MNLVEKYLGESKQYIHIVDDNGEFSVIHSVHNEPSMGGQQLKSFKNKKKAVEFAFKIEKDEVIFSWKKKGNKWTDKEIHTKLSKLRGK